MNVLCFQHQCLFGSVLTGPSFPRAKYASTGNCGVTTQVTIIHVSLFSLEYEESYILLRLTMMKRLLYFAPVYYIQSLSPYLPPSLSLSLFLSLSLSLSLSLTYRLRNIFLFASISFSSGSTPSSGRPYFSTYACHLYITISCSIKKNSIHIHVHVHAHVHVWTVHVHVVSHVLCESGWGNWREERREAYLHIMSIALLSILISVQ